MSAAWRNLNVGQALVQGRNVTLTAVIASTCHSTAITSQKNCMIMYDPNLPKAVGCMTVPPLIQECHIVLLGFFRRYSTVQNPPAETMRNCSRSTPEWLEKKMWSLFCRTSTVHSAWGHATPRFSLLTPAYITHRYLMLACKIPRCFGGNFRLAFPYPQLTARHKQGGWYQLRSLRRASSAGHISNPLGRLSSTSSTGDIHTQQSMALCYF